MSICSPDKDLAQCVTCDRVACVAPDGQSNCAPSNGMVFDGNSHPTLITAAEGAAYQAAYQAAVDAR